MDISVIVPIYNVEPFIERCLRSIMNQTFTEGIECILVNDCTPDNSLRIAEQLIEEYTNNTHGDEVTQNRIQFKVVSHERNLGIAATRNTGLKAATGTYIQFIDSDDYIEPNMLEELSRCLYTKKADIIVCDFLIENKQGTRYKKQIKKETPQEYLIDTLTDILPAFVWNKLYRRDLFIQHNFNMPIEVSNMGEDLIINAFAFYYACIVSYHPYAYYHYCRENTKSYCNNISNRQLESQKACIDYLENVLFYNLNESSPYYLPFMESKNRVKTAILVHGDKSLRKKYGMVFREANKYIFNYSKRRFCYKILLMLNRISPTLRDSYIHFINLLKKIRQIISV